MNTPPFHHAKRDIQIFAFLLGFLSLISQVILLRELSVVFYGNEISYAIILASWLFWIAVGSQAASVLLKYFHQTQRILNTVFMILSILLPILITACRIVRSILQIQSGEMLSIAFMSGIAFVILAPLTLLLGASFPLMCRLGEENTPFGKETVSSGQIYLWESVGAVFGGLLLNFILLPNFTAFEITAITLFVILCRTALSVKNKKTRIFWGGLPVVLFLVVILSGSVERYDRWTRQKQFAPLAVVTSQDSIYGNITLTRTADSYSLFENGLLSYSTKDDFSSEENVHYALLSHPHPKRILLIGGGAGGSLKEILKYGDVKIDYVELDPKVIAVSFHYLPAPYVKAIRDPRVRVIYTDGRLFVKRNTAHYDIVLVNLSDPTTALINRYYTLEFFKEVRKILNPGGILSFGVTSSENYYSEELKEFLRSIHSTLDQVFRDSKVLPGDRNIFLASNQPHILTYDSRILIERLKERKISTQFVREYYIPYRLSEERIAGLKNIFKKDGPVNTDLKPVVYLFDTVLWSTHFNQTFKKAFGALRNLTLFHLEIMMGALWILIVILQKKNPKLSLGFSIAVTGFWGIIFQVMIILTFQSLYGYAYERIGLIMASFMLGLALGSLWARKLIKHCETHLLPIYRKTQAALCVFTFLLPVVFEIFSRMSTGDISPDVLTYGFLILPVIAGLFGGLQYPIGTFLCHRQSSAASEEWKTAGNFYALDVFGASFGALLTGAILIPLLGINAVAVFCGLLNTAVLGLLFLL